MFCVNSHLRALNFKKKPWIFTADLPCGAQFLRDRTLELQSRGPRFESPLLLYQIFGIFAFSTTPKFTELYKWVHGYRRL